MILFWIIGTSSFKTPNSQTDEFWEQTILDSKWSKWSACDHITFILNFEYISLKFSTNFILWAKFIFRHAAKEFFHIKHEISLSRATRNISITLNFASLPAFCHEMRTKYMSTTWREFLEFKFRFNFNWQFASEEGYLIACQMGLLHFPHQVS